jgi:hypothetical protein
VLLVLADRLSMDEVLQEARRGARDALTGLITAAHQEGSLRPDVTGGDIVLLVVRVTPPLPGLFPAEDNRRLGHRHLELILDGMLRFVSNENLPGPATSFDDVLPLGPSPGNRVNTDEIPTNETDHW